MATEQRSGLAFVGGARVTGLPASAANGQPVVHEQFLAAALLAVALTVTPVAYGYAEVVVAATGVSATSKVVAACAATLDEENDVEEWSDSDLLVVGVPEVNQIRFVLVSSNAAPFVGVFNIDYRVSL